MSYARKSLKYRVKVTQEIAYNFNIWDKFPLTRLPTVRSNINPGTLTVHR